MNYCTHHEGFHWLDLYSELCKGISTATPGTRGWFAQTVC